MKVIISDHKMGNVCDVRAGGTDVSLRSPLPLGQLSLQAGTCCGARAWGEDALWALGQGFGF